MGATGVGAHAVDVAGPRTRDAGAFSALRTYDVSAAAGVARPADADAAFRELVDDRDDLARTFWVG